MRIVLSTLLFLINVSSCFATGFTIEWGYTPPSSPAVVGYRLYLNNSRLIDFEGAKTERASVYIYTPVNGDVFTLTALFEDNTESASSSPYVFKSDAILAPILNSVTINK